MSRLIPDKIILGDNQFFGVNHMSQEKGRESEARFKDLSKVKDSLYTALDYGVTGVMFSTHPSIYQITDMMRADKKLRTQMGIYVNLPYIMKYVRMLSEAGMFETIKTTLTGNNTRKNIMFFCRSIGSLLSGNYYKMIHRLIDVELNPFHGLQVKAVFLHNAICDLLLGYGLKDIIADYDRYVSKKLNLLPAYGTLNYPKFSKMLVDAGLNESIVMASVNKKGFLMNPGRVAAEQGLSDYNHRVLAMCTLASGRIKPKEAYEYLFNLPNIESVVVGLSSKKHADETFSILNGYMNPDRGVIL